MADAVLGEQTVLLMTGSLLREKRVLNLPTTEVSAGSTPRTGPTFLLIWSGSSPGQPR